MSKKLVHPLLFVTTLLISAAIPLSLTAEQAGFITFKDVKLHALGNSPLLRELGLELDKEIAQAMEVESLQDPQLQASMGLPTSDEIGGPEKQIQVSLTQPIRLSDFGVRGDVSRLLRIVASRENKFAIQNFITKLALAYDTLWRLQNLAELRALAEEVRRLASSVEGVVDLYVEQQVLVPQVHIRIDREQAALLGLTVQQVAEIVETALKGRVVTRVIEEQRNYDVVLRVDDVLRKNAETLKQLPIILNNGQYVPLEAVANIERARGPNTIARENTSRRIVVSANIANRDIVSAVEEIQLRVSQNMPLPEGYFISYGGQFESQVRASSLIYVLGALALASIFLVLYFHYRSLNLTLQVMLAVPFSFIGGILGVYVSGGVLSIASLVGFITLTGIATRNGIMMIDHYLHLMSEEGENFTLQMIYRGASERLVPVLMTALTAILALTPILLGAEAPGKEILYPVAVVIFSGLFTGTILNLLITPVAFWLLGKNSRIP